MLVVTEAVGALDHQLIVRSVARSLPPNLPTKFFVAAQRRATRRGPIIQRAYSSFSFSCSLPLPAVYFHRFFATLFYLPLSAAQLKDTLNLFPHFHRERTPDSHHLLLPLRLRLMPNVPVLVSLATFAAVLR